jgi:hypothetical protein
MTMPALEHELEYEFEGEFEGELEAEYEFEVNPIRRIYREAELEALMEMEHLGHAASMVASEAEAEAFIGALVPIAARLIPRVAPAIMRAAPNLIRGATRVVRSLRRNPATRPLVRAVPAIVRRTTASLARQAAQGRPITARSASQTLAHQAARVLANPRQATNAVQRSCALDRRYHRQPTRPRRHCPVCGGRRR